MQNASCFIHLDRSEKALGDLFGLFFEDLNHAADGGLYAELVRNRSFEFDPIDHPEYHALTGWRVLGGASVSVETQSPLHPCNPHYAVVQAQAADGGIENQGFGAGICLTEGESYHFSCFARSGKPVMLCAEVGGACAEILVQGPWRQYHAQLIPTQSTTQGRLRLTLAQPGTVDLDMVSLFPRKTFMRRENGLRKDLAEAIAAMQPRFLRFPGGCLVHDGVLDTNARDGMYCWKNTLGPVHQRPPRRNSWRYHQTLGLGFYEYFLFCEDIGAKPLPVVSGGCDPHHKRFAPMDQLQPWIDDALDLIEFANGAADTKWGAVRAQMGHPEPFGMEYIGIGNEEVGAAFFERLPHFVRAIREKYPQIRIIGTSGPFAEGGEYDRGWASARALGVDLVDEHYYQAPEWYLAHMDRYHKYPQDGPKVFLGEYASWGNAFENALVEAAYMVEMQNAPAVALACYAPMLCHVEYVNWKPDMIWFDGGRVLKTANYHVQRLFMCHQGDDLLQIDIQGLQEDETPRDTPVAGRIALGVNDITAHFSGITLREGDGAVQSFADCTLSGQGERLLCETNAARYTLECTVRRTEGWKGVRICFGRQDADNQVVWGVGGWENQDSLLDVRTRGRGSCLTQCEFSMEDHHAYHLRLEVVGRRIRTYIDGVLMNDTHHALPRPKRLYLSASRERASGDVIVKAVNVLPQPVGVEISLPEASGTAWNGTAYVLRDIPLDAENTFDNPERVCPREYGIQAGPSGFHWQFPPHSVTVLRLCEKQ